MRHQEELSSYSDDGTASKAGILRSLKKTSNAVLCTKHGGKLWKHTVVI